MIVTVCLNPAVDKTVTVEHLTVGGVNRVLTTRSDPGGKGINVAKVAAALGGDVLCIGILGGATGEYIQMCLNDMGVRHDFLIRGDATRVNLKIMDAERRTMTELNKCGAPVTEEELRQVWEKIDCAAKPGDIVALSGANPPRMADDMLADWITRLRKKGVFVALDTVGNPMRLGVRAGPALIKPNREELAEFCGEPLRCRQDVIDAAQKIARQGVDRVVVSLGGDGALFITEGEVLLGHGLPIKVESTVGSGDAMLAALLYCTARGDSWEIAAKCSIAAGAVNAMTSGSRTPDVKLIRKWTDRVVMERLV